MPQRGRLTDWNDERGFGHITPLEGGATVFAHISEFPRDRRRPLATDLLEYDLTQDDRGRSRAIRIRFLSAAGARSPRPLPSKSVALPVPAMGVAGGFLLVVFIMAAVGRVPWSVVLAYAFMSGLTFVAYAHDKDAAQRGQWRTGEGTLILLGLLGGWPGGFVAQELLRHKTKKQPFRAVFWASVVANIGLLLWIAVAMPLRGLS